MSMYNLLFFLAGCLLTTLYFRSKRKKVPIHVNRKGLVIMSYTASTISGRQEEIDAEIELEEIDATDHKSKVKSVSITVGKSKYNTNDYKKKIREMFDNTWIESNSIEWLVKSKEVYRPEKLDKILN